MQYFIMEMQLQTLDLTQSIRNAPCCFVLVQSSTNSSLTLWVTCIWKESSPLRGVDTRWPVRKFHFAMTWVYLDCQPLYTLCEESYQNARVGRLPVKSTIPDVPIRPINKIMKQFENVENFKQGLHEIFTRSFLSATCKYIKAVAAADEGLQKPTHLCPWSLTLALRKENCSGTCRLLPPVAEIHGFSFP